MALSQWLGRIAIGADNKDFNLGGTAFSLTAGYYFLSGYTGEATAQLCQHMEDIIQVTYAADTVAYSASTGKVTITCASSRALVWTDTALGELLGFTEASYDAASSFTGENECQYLWRPDTAIADCPVSPMLILEPVTSTQVHVSRDGTPVTVLGNTRYSADIGYQLVDGERVRIPSTGTVNKEFESFFKSVIAAGEQIRLYPDRTVNTSTDYVTVIVTGGGEAIGSFSSFAKRRFASYDGLWDLSIPVVKYVS